MRMLKKALIAYVNSAKAVWSAVAHPLSIVSKLKRNVKDYKIFGKTQYGKNLLDVKTLYGKYANDNGGITLHSGQLANFVFTEQKPLKGVFKEKTAYTFSFKYNITEAETVIQPQFNYTDGTKNYIYIGTQMGDFNDYITIPSEGVFSFTSNGDKTISSFNFTYGSNSKRFECELTEMMIAEGTDTEYEPCNPQYVGDVVAEGDNTGKYHLPVEVRGKNILDMSGLIVRSGYYLDSSGEPSNNTLNNTMLRVSAIKVKPSETYTISSNLNFYTIWLFDEENIKVKCITAYNLRKKNFTTPDNCHYIRVSFRTYEGTYMPTDLKCLMLEKGEGDGIYEPYIEPHTADIYLDAPLADGEVIQKSVDKLPSLLQFKGTTVYEINTTVKPQGVQVEYY